MSQKWTLERYQKQISIFFPNWRYDVISFQGAKKPCKIICKLCGREITLNQANYLFNRNNPCVCYTEFLDYKAKAEYLGQYFDFSVIADSKTATNNITTRCDRCGTFQTRSMIQIAMAPSHCPNCNNYAASRDAGIPREEAELRLKTFDENYTLLEYQGYSKPALLKHNCGFVFKTTKLADLINRHNRGCPKCNPTKSKGEQSVEKYLLDHHIKYVAQKTFLPDGEQYYYRFDFFLPTYNIAIEYQGEQHYRDNGFAREGLERIQQRDETKRRYCREQGIILWEIPYTQLKNIRNILDLKFNDYDDKSVAEKAK